MEQAFLVGQQVLIVFIYIVIGIICVRGKVMTEAAGTHFSNFSLIVITPCLIIGSYQRPVNSEDLKCLGLAFFLAVIFHVISITVSFTMIRRRGDGRYRIERLGNMFSNCGYMAIPLIAVAVGEQGVFYAGAFISVFSMLLWTVGIMALTGERKFELRRAFLNPAVISFIIGMTLYLAGIQLPSIPSTVIDNIVGMNTPLTMITTGIFLANINLKKTFSNPHIYYTSFLRLLVTPFAMLLFIKLFGVSGWIPGAAGVIMANIIASSCPCAAATMQFPARYKLDSSYGSSIIAVSTLFSIITIPFMTYLTDLLI